MCASVCMRSYIYAYIHTYIHMLKAYSSDFLITLRICMYLLHMYEYVYVEDMFYIYIYIYIYIYTHTHIQTCWFVLYMFSIYIYIYIYLCVYIYIYIYMPRLLMYVCMNVCMHMSMSYLCFLPLIVLNPRLACASVVITSQFCVCRSGKTWSNDFVNPVCVCVCIYTYILHILVMLTHKIR